MDAVLTGKGISVAYQQNIIIPSMNVEIPRGCVTSVIGPNGCGKSTLLKALSRMLPVRSGQVLPRCSASTTRTTRNRWRQA